MNEVVQSFSDDVHTKVRITIDLSAEKSDGFDVTIQRTVSENCQTLKVKDWGFEGERMDA